MARPDCQLRPLLDRDPQGHRLAGPVLQGRVLIQQPWSTGDLVVNELLGYASKTGGSIYWQGPHQYPLDPTGRSLCCEASVIGVGRGSEQRRVPGLRQRFFRRGALSRADDPMYAANDPENLMGIDPATPLLWASQDMDFLTDYILLDRSAYTFASDSKKSNVPVRIKSNIIIFDITFHRVPYMPTSLVTSAGGCVNSTTFMSGGVGKIPFKGAARIAISTLTDHTSSRCSSFFTTAINPGTRYFGPTPLHGTRCKTARATGPITPMT